MAGEITVGAVAVDIVPSAKGFGAKLAKEIAPQAAAVAETLSKSFEKEIADGTSDGVKKGLKDGKKGAAKEGAEAGGEFSGGFAAAVRAGLKAAQAAIGDFKVTASVDLNATGARAQLAALKAEIKEFSDVKIGVDLDAPTVLAKAAAIKAALKDLNQQNSDLGLGSEIRNATKAVDGLVERMQAANTQTGSFAKKVDAFYKSILDTFTDTDIDIPLRVEGGKDLDEATKQVTALRENVRQFRQDNAQGLFGGEQVKEQIDGIVAQLDKLKSANLNPRLRYEVDEIKRATDAFVGDLTGIKDKTVKVKVDADTGTLTGFAAQIQKVAAKAAGQITLRVGLDSDSVYPEAAKIKAELEGIVAKVGIEYDDAEAFGRVRLLTEALKDLSKDRSVHIGVDRDVVSAGSVLSKLVEDTDSAQSGFSALNSGLDRIIDSLSKMTPLAAAMNIAFVGGLVALPAILAIIAAGLAGILGLLTAIAGLAVTVGLGLGVLALALAPILKAIQAQKTATQQATQATLDAAQAEQTALANKLALASADQAVASAEKTLARARTSGQKSVTQAARTLAGAQRNLTIANQKETDARKKLSTAYVDAKNDLKALNAEIKKNKAEVESASASVLQARIAYNQLLADPTASQADITTAQAKYSSSQADVSTAQADLQKNQTLKAKYDRDGLAANAGVISAQADLKSAIEAVSDATDAQKTAAENSAQAQIDATNSVNDAEQALAQARTARTNTLKQQQLAATVTAAQKTNTNATQDDAMSQLSKKGLEFVQFYEKTLKPVIGSILKTAQDSGILSGIEGFFDAIRPALTPLKGLITSIGHGLGVFFIQIGNFLGSKEGTDFINFLAKEAPKGFEILAKIAKGGLGFVFKLFEKFGPVMDKLAPVLADVLDDIGDILIQFLESDDFKELIQTMVDNLPLILYTVVDLLIALAKIIPILAPLGSLLLTILDNMLQFFDSIPNGLIEGILSALLVVLGLVVAAAGSVVSAIVAVILIVLGVVLAITYVYKNWDEIWGKIKDVASGAYDYLKRILTGWADSFRTRWHSLTSGIHDLWFGLFGENGSVRNALSGFTDWAKLALERTVDLIGKIWSGIKFALASPVVGVYDLLNVIIDGVNLVGKVFGFNVDKIKLPKWVQDATGLKTSGFATGGIVPGYQSSKRDEVPAMLRKGEGVLVPEAVKQLGGQTILDWNKRASLGQSIRHFAYGGLVDQIVDFEKKSGVPFTVTSGLRNTNDLHGKGEAVDTADTAQNMVRLASWLYGYSPYLLELIHSGGSGYFVKNGQKKGADFYRSVIAEHYSHVHTAMNQAGLNAVQSGIEPAEMSDDSSSGGLLSWALGKITDTFKPAVDTFLAKFGKTDFGKWMGQVPAVFLKKITGWLRDKAGGLGSVVTDAVGDVSGFLKSLVGIKDTPSAHEKGDMASPITAAGYAKSQLKTFGWDSTDMEYLAKLWNGESGWRWNAKNPSSGAYGIPQSLPGTKMASVNADWATNAFTQVLWGMGYIKDRYKDPTNAYLTWLGRSPHWYDTGGYLPPGLTMAYNGTGKNERVMTHEQEQDMMRERSALLRGGADINVHVHDGKVSGLVTAEIDKQFGALADSYVYGGL